MRRWAPLELHVGTPTGTIIASLPVSNTGGWQSWTTVKAALTSRPSGVQPLYAVFRGPSPYVGVANLNWLDFGTH